jgi:DNA-binding beta-propeller fold protein YncE
LVTIVAAPSKLNVLNDLNIKIYQSEKPGESQEKCEKAKNVEKDISGNAVNKENSSIAAADIKTRSEKTVKSEKCVKAKAKNVDMNNEATKSSPAVPKVLKMSSKFIMKGLKKQPERLSGIAVNKENSKIAIGDFSSHCVNIFNKAGDFLQAYGSHGNGKGKLSSPQGLAFLNEDELVIADNGNNRICIVNTRTGTLVKSFGDRVGGNEGLDNPRGVHVDDDCNIIVSDNHRIKVYTKDGELKFHFGLKKGERFSPVSVVTHDGRYYVSDRVNDVIQVFGNNDCLPTKISVIGKAGKGMDGQLSDPWGLTIDNDHNLLVCDNGNQRIQKFTLDGRFIAKTTNGGIIRWINHIAVLKDNHFMVTAGSDGVLIFQ